MFTPNSPDELPKLVRDNIPEIIMQNEGKKALTRRLDDDSAFLEALLQKAIEEANELAAQHNEDYLIKELADLYEIIDAILALKGKTRADVDAAQTTKRQTVGGFDKRLLLLDKE